MAAVSRAVALVPLLAAFCTSSETQSGQVREDVPVNSPRSIPDHAAEDCVEAVTLVPCAPSEVAPRLRFAAAVELPADNPMGSAVPFNLDLRRHADGTIVGVFSRLRSAEVDAAGQMRTLGPIGPADLEGLEFATADHDLVLAARGVSHERLRELAVAVERNGIDALGEPIASQVPSWVPGVGSLPLPPTNLAYVISYTMDVGEQQSLAVGTLRAEDDDLTVLSWWYGDHSETAEVDSLSLTADAYATPDGGSESPDARITIVVGGNPKRAVIVRSVGLSDGEHSKALTELHFVRADEWRALVEATRESRTSAANEQR